MKGSLMIKKPCDMLSICKLPRRLRFQFKPKVLRTCMESPGPSLKVWFSPNEFPTFKYSVPNWWPCLGRYKRCGLAGGNMSLGTGFEISKATYHSQCSLTHSYSSEGKPSAGCSCHHFLVCHALPSGLLPWCQVTAHGQLRLHGSLLA